MKSKGVVWFRKDLRLTDNPAWSQATMDHDEVTALFVVDPALWDLAGDNRRNQLAAHLRHSTATSLPAAAGCVSFEETQ